MYSVTAFSAIAPSMKARSVMELLVMTGLVMEVSVMVRLVMAFSAMAHWVMAVPVPVPVCWVTAVLVMAH